MAVATANDDEDPGEGNAMVGSSTGGASEKPVQNVQKNPEKDPAETKNEGTLEEQKQEHKENDQG